MILELIDEACDKGARLAPACRAICLDPRTVQRWRDRQRNGRPLDDERRGPRRKPGNALTSAERARLLAVVNSPEFRDLSPTSIIPLLADRGQYLGSESTVYRILREEKQLAHRGRSRPRTRRRPREHVATGPGQVWSWDITYLRGPVRGRFLQLYLVVDIWSRMIVAAEVHAVEDDAIAARMIDDAARRHGIESGGLVLHSDNGNAMRGSTMLATLQSLGVMPSFSRPRCSNDNPFSESLFGTMKGIPAYPEDGRFESDEAAIDWVDAFVHWYNHVHLHSAIRFVTPADRHFGRDIAILEARHAVYRAARQRRPERWTGETRNWSPPSTVRLNPKRTADRPAPDTGRRHQHHHVLSTAAVGSQEPADRRGRKHRPLHTTS